jgi:tetratricopeptide (TPR) repeat protein
MPRSALGLLASLVLCAISHLSASRAQGTSDLSKSPKWPPIATWLNSGDVVRQEISFHNCDAIELTVDQDEPELRIQVLGSSGEEIRELRPGYPGRLLVSFPNTEGSHVLVLDSSGAIARGVRIRVRIVPVAIPRQGLEARMRAEDLFVRAQELRAQPKSQAAQRAIEILRDARRQWARIGDHDGQALALLTEADVWLGLSRYDRAISSINEARTLGRVAPEYQSLLLNEETRIDLDLWDSASALRHAGLAMRLSERSGERGETAETLAHRGEAQYLETNDEAAGSDLRAALTAARENGDRLTVARVLRCQAWIEEDQGHLAQAGQLMQNAEEQFHSVGDESDSVDAISDLATIEGMTGDHYAALLTHSRVADVIYESGRSRNFAYVLDNIATDYAELNRDRDAVVYFEKAQDIFTGIHHLSGQMTTLGQLCMAELRLNHFQQALTQCQRALSLSHLVLDPKRRAIAEWRLAKVEARMGRFTGALAEFKDAVSTSEAVHDCRFASRALIDLAELLGKMGDEEAEWKAYDRALTASLSAEDSGAVMEAQFHIAAYYRAHRQFDDAKRELDGLLRSIEEQRVRVGNDELRASFFAMVRKSYALYVDVLMQEFDNRRSEALLDQALEMSEAGRGRTLMDSAYELDGSPEARSDSRDDGKISQLRAAIDQAYDERLKLMLAGTSSPALRQNTANLRQWINEYDRLSDMRKHRSQPARLADGPMAAAEIREATRASGSVFFEYALGSTQSYLWIIHDGVVESHKLPDEAQISSIVTKWRVLVSSRARREANSFAEYLKRVDASDRELPQVASQLSCVLFGDFLKPEMKRVAIAADGALQGLSFAALPTNGCSSVPGSPVVREHEIISVPSISVVTRLKHNGLPASFNRDLAILADPVFDGDDPRIARVESGTSQSRALGVIPNHSNSVLALPRLIATRQEAASITSLFPPERVMLAMDFDASLKTLLSEEIGGFRIVHVATHGTADLSAPEMSGLVFSLFDPQGRPVHGFLTAHELSELKLHSELVVLSSCNSGIGEEVNGEGSRSVAYSFLHAGARNVISTLWNVDDDVSGQLMVGFYQQLLKNAPPSEALRRAQLEILARARTSHPFYWAGFVISSGMQ